MYAHRLKRHVSLLTLYSAVMSLLLLDSSRKWTREERMLRGDGDQVFVAQGCIPGARAMPDAQLSSNPNLLEKGGFGVYFVVCRLTSLSLVSKQERQKHIRKPVSTLSSLPSAPCCNSSVTPTSKETLLPTKCVYARCHLSFLSKLL